MNDDKDDWFQNLKITIRPEIVVISEPPPGEDGKQQNRLIILRLGDQNDSENDDSENDDGEQA